MPSMKQDQVEKLIYAFRHLVSGHGTDAHAGDSMDLGVDTLTEMGLTADTIEVVVNLAQEVGGNYSYTGEADQFTADIRAGRV